MECNIPEESFIFDEPIPKRGVLDFSVRRGSLSEKENREKSDEGEKAATGDENVDCKEEEEDDDDDDDDDDDEDDDDEDDDAMREWNPTRIRKHSNKVNQEKEEEEESSPVNLSIRKRIQNPPRIVEYMLNKGEIEYRNDEDEDEE